MYLRSVNTGILVEHKFNNIHLIFIIFEFKIKFHFICLQRRVQLTRHFDLHYFVLSSVR